MSYGFGGFGTEFSKTLSCELIHVRHGAARPDQGHVLSLFPRPGLNQVQARL